jgi:hypothetical protein
VGRPTVETLPWLAFARRIIRRAGERVADADEFELAELVSLRDDLEAAIAVAVAGQQQRTSWQRIGDALGITRQAAQQRYGKRASA